MCMEIEHTEHGAPSHSEAMARIGIIEQQAQQMGANDYESSAFKRIREELERGERTPSEAVAAAQIVLDTKQDYH